MASILSDMEEDRLLDKNAADLSSDEREDPQSAIVEHQHSVSSDGPITEENKTVNNERQMLACLQILTKGQEEFHNRQDVLGSVLNQLLQRQVVTEDLVRTYLKQPTEENSQLKGQLRKMPEQGVFPNTNGRAENPDEYSKFMASDREHPDTISGYPWSRLSEPDSKLSFGDSGHMMKNVDGYPFRSAVNHPFGSHSLDLNLEPKEVGLTEVFSPIIVQSPGGATHCSIPQTYH